MTVNIKDFMADDIQAMFEYLDALRESGVTNMFGATPYLVDEFELSKLQATCVLKAWMSTFDDIPASERAGIALGDDPEEAVQISRPA